MVVLCLPLDDDSSLFAVPASPVVKATFVQGIDGVVGPVGVLPLLELRFAEACVERCGGFGTSSGLVVVVGNDMGNSSDSSISVPCGVEFLRGLEGWDA